MSQNNLPNYQETIFRGANQVPIYGIVAIPENPHSTFIGTYGVTGSIKNQWLLQLLGKSAFTNGYAVVLFDWRSHGETAKLSFNLSSDGLYEGEDFIRIASQAKKMGCPSPFCLTGYSLGGQLALWGIKFAQTINQLEEDLDLTLDDLGGSAVVCPNLDSLRSLQYIMKHPTSKFLEKSITRNLKKLAEKISQYHPNSIKPEAISRIKSIWSFDQELVIEKLGFKSVEAYYQATNALNILADLQKPILILYDTNDPFFDPSIVTDLQDIVAKNPFIDLRLTSYGGHAGYLKSDISNNSLADDYWLSTWDQVFQWWNRLK